MCPCKNIKICTINSAALVNTQFAGDGNDLHWVAFTDTIQCVDDIINSAICIAFFFVYREFTRSFEIPLYTKITQQVEIIKNLCWYAWFSIASFGSNTSFSLTASISWSCEWYEDFKRVSDHVQPPLANFYAMTIWSEKDFGKIFYAFCPMSFSPSTEKIDFQNIDFCPKYFALSVCAHRPRTDCWALRCPTFSSHIFPLLSYACCGL